MEKYGNKYNPKYIEFIERGGDMNKPKIVNYIEMDGTDVLFESLPEEKRKEIAVIIQERIMSVAGYRRKSG